MKSKILLTLITSLILVSCNPSTTNRRVGQDGNTVYNNDQYQYPDNGNGNGNDNGNGNGNGSGDQTDDGDGYGDGNEDGHGSQAQDYIEIKNITLHGTAGLNRHYPNGGPLWSSFTQFDLVSQEIFATNSRFNLRVRPQAAPTQNTTDSLGIRCKYPADPYKKLSINVCVRAANGSCIYTHNFSEVTVGQVSKVKEFSIPTTSAALVVEILGVQWDFSCQDYLDQGYSINDPEISRFCPVASVFDTSCIKFDFQFSTDNTKDFPPSAPRY